MPRIFTLALSLFLTVIAAGCAVTPNPEAMGPYPTHYKEVIKTHIQRSFFDPYSLRGVSISMPMQGHLFFQQGWIVCLEANAKNRMGGYIGLQRTAYLLNYDAVLQSMDKAPLCNNPQVSYTPWPEIEENAPASSKTVSQTESAAPTLSQKEKWVTTMAKKNGCDGAIRVDFKSKDGIREIFEAVCDNKKLEFTCEFGGPVSEAMGGIPFVAVTGKSYQTQPACWR